MDLSNNIPPEFQNLNIRDQQKVANLIKKLYNKTAQEISPEISTENTKDTEDTEGKHDRSVRRPPISQVNKLSEQNTPRQKKTKIKKELQRTTGEDKPNKQKSIVGTVDITIPINAENRPNFFINNGFRDLHKADSKIDQKLWGKNEITERSTRHEIVEVECSECGKVCQVSTKLVYQDEDGLHFTCNRCQKRRKN